MKEAKQTRQHSPEQIKEQTINELTNRFDLYINWLLNGIIKQNWDLKGFHLNNVLTLINKMNEVLKLINYPDFLK